MKKIKIEHFHLHPHLKERMDQRGVTKKEIEKTLLEGWEAEDAKSGTSGKVYVFTYKDHWEGDYFEEKEVIVYYKYADNQLVLLTVKARYGENFSKKSQ